MFRVSYGPSSKVGSQFTPIKVGFDGGKDRSIEILQGPNAASVELDAQGGQVLTKYIGCWQCPVILGEYQDGIRLRA